MKRNGLITNFRCLPYNPDLKERAREMRKISTKGEIKFWCELLRHMKSGYQFYRQKPIYHFIVDFYSSKLKLVVEVDGTSHNDKLEYDKYREEILEQLDLKVLHYDDLTVLNNFQKIESDFKKQIRIREKELGIKNV